MDRLFQSLVYQFKRRSWYLMTYRNVASKLIDNPELIRQEDTKKLSEVFPKTFDFSMIKNGMFGGEGDDKREKFVEELSTFERHFNKNMYFNYKIPELKFHRKWNETMLNGQSKSWNLQDWNGDVHFGLGCFRSEDNSMFSPNFSTKVYGLHGKGEILVAKQLFLRFNDIDLLNQDDLVLMRDPREPHNNKGKGVEEGSLLVRRVTGLPGETIQSQSNPEHQIELKQNEVWVEADKWVEDRASSEEELTQAGIDSRVFGPVDCEDHVFGRVIYSIRSAVDHGPVANLSPESQSWDQLWASDLDVEEILELY
jgi:hypothetical protein